MTGLLPTEMVALAIGGSHEVCQATSTLNQLVGDMPIAWIGRPARGSGGSGARCGASAREEVQHQAIDLGCVLVRGPVAGPGNPVQVEGADGLPDLADQEIRRAERRVVALAPQQPNATAEVGEIVQERAAAAHLAAVEAGAPHAVDLDVDRLLGEAGRVAEHVHQQVVTTDLAEEALVVAGLLVAADRPVAEATC